ncbi:MAG: efflux RND transporter periplasmic adaptor subunit [Hungatella sp.]
MAAVVLLGVKSMLGGGSMPQMVMTSPVTRGNIEEALSVSGPVSGTDSVDVVSNLHAEVLEIQVKEGDKVEKDQVLAVVDSTDIQKEVDIAQNAYDLAVSTLQEQQIAAENGYAKAQQDFQAAKTAFDRTNVLFQSGSVSQLEWETAKNVMDDAERQLRTFTLKDGRPVANESYSLQVQNAAFELEKKQTALENTVIKSPIAGTVVRVNAKVGRFADTIEDDKAMFSIENLETLEMKIPISEYSIGKVSVGQEAEISADILNGETVQGQVTAISPTGEEKGGGSTERVIPTTIRIEDKNTRLIAGITAKAKIRIREASDTLIVPISALIQQGDGTYVAAVENNMIRMVPVETGVESDIQVEVILPEGETLTEGTQVVTGQVAGLTDGMQVTAVPAV